MLMTFLPMQALQALFSYCQDVWASSKAEVCLLAMVLCVVVGFLWPRENKGIPGHLSFNTTSATDLQCGFRQITSYLLE